PDRISVRGLQPKPPGDDTMLVRLTEALRFTKKPSDVTDESDLEPGPHDIPAAEFLELPNKELTSRTDAHGGTFVELLVPYLMDRKPSVYLDDNPKARSGFPPPLLLEGEKVQTSWLFQFLKNPTKIRRVTILRMPHFNMSDDEAMTFVNFFAAMDRRENPAVNLTYPYETIPQRGEDFLAKEGEQYMERLGQPAIKQRAEQEKLQTQVWDRMLQDRISELQGDVKAAEDALKSAKAEEQKSALARRDQLQTELKTLTDEAKQQDGPYRR